MKTKREAIQVLRILRRTRELIQRGWMRGSFFDNSSTDIHNAADFQTCCLEGAIWWSTAESYGSCKLGMLTPVSGLVKSQIHQTLKEEYNPAEWNDAVATNVSDVIDLIDKTVARVRAVAVSLPLK